MMIMVCVCVYLCVCVRICICVPEGGREREKTMRERARVAHENERLHITHIEIEVIHRNSRVEVRIFDYVF